MILGEEYASTDGNYLTMRRIRLLGIVMTTQTSTSRKRADSSFSGISSVVCGVQRWVMKGELHMEMFRTVSLPDQWDELKASVHTSYANEGNPVS